MSQLELVASFFQDRIEKITTDQGFDVYVQRPKASPEGVAAAASVELPDDFVAGSEITANSAKQLYRVAIGPLTVVISFVPADFGVEIAAKLKLPIVGEVTVAKVKGNLKQGVVLHAKYSDLLRGDVGVKLNGSTVVLYWDISAFGNDLKDEINLFTI